MPSERDCTHRDQVADVKPSADGCEDCLLIGSEWVHLRMCLICGHAGCCDSSPNRHASEHVTTTGHPLITSIDPPLDWIYCYLDDALMRPGTTEQESP